MKHAFPGLWLSLAAACAGAAPSAGGGRDDDSIVNPQGTGLQSLPVPLEAMYVPLTGWTRLGDPLRDVSVVKGELVARGRPIFDGTDRLEGADLTGAVLPGRDRRGEAVPLRVVAVRDHENLWNGPPAGDHQFDYWLEYRDDDGQWQALCPSGGPAVAVPGRFLADPSTHRPNGDYLADRDHVTFACADGVAAKCIDWGFAPWDDRVLYQTCTRMARADYCGTGRPHTVDGTLVAYQVGSAPTLPTGFQLEAVWSKGDGRDGRAAAVCVARSRWTTLGIGPREACAERAAAAPPDCDDAPVAHWLARGGVMVSASAPLDVALYQWTDGRRYVTGRASSPDARPPTGFDRLVDVVGAAYHPNPKQAVGPRFAARLASGANVRRAGRDRFPGLVPLYRYRRADGSALTTTDATPPAGYGERQLEAFVFVPSATPPVSTAVELCLFAGLTDTTRDEFATGRCDDAPPGYGRGRSLGWLPHASSSPAFLGGLRGP